MEENSTCQSSSPNLFEDVEVQTCSKNSSGAVSSLGKGDRQDGSDENIVGGARLDREVRTDTETTQNSDDLRENGTQTNDDSDMNKSSTPSSSEETSQLPQLSNNVDSEDNQPVLDSRRKSTRSRPRTRKSLGRT
ncbi:hypothetical protein TIFTF001_007321 [Ficus carica]|uniref:Uncharacterized protein n=1 Tax=Ficus carica TaxID=3494 RepID=A0AA87ZRH6_FICCA|nr:hypothetical protein TIFTF001_007321 [Ficus carica]